MTFLRTALNAQRKKRGEAELSTPEFMRRVRETARGLGIDQEMLRRASFALYNIKDEVDRLALSLVKAREFFA